MTTITMKRLWLSLAVVILAPSTLGGCGSPPWEAAESTPSVSLPNSSATTTITPVVNELATGSAQRLLQAGDIALTLNYWSTLSMSDWRAEENKPVSFSMTATLGADQGQRVYLSRVTVTPALSGPDGALPAASPITDQASVSPGYFIKAPYSYSETFILPPSDPATTTLTLSFTYELLLQTTPTSNDYAKQTATDSLTIALSR